MVNKVQPGIELDRYSSENSQSKNDELKGNFTKSLVLYLGCALIGAAFQVGWNIGIFNTPSETIENHYRSVYAERYNKPMTNGTFTLLWSITNSLMPLGATVGGLSSGFIADSVGRKNGLIFTNAIVILGAVLNIISKFVKSYETLMIGRLMSGLISGLFTGILPLYLTELSPQNLRGVAGASNQLMIVFGILITNIFGLPDILGSEKLWPVLLGFMLVPALAHIGLFFAVESPKYLYINKNNPEEAKRALIQLRGADNMQLVENELSQLQAEKEKLSKQQQVSWGDMIQVRTLRRPLMIASFIHIAQQFSGINAVIFYSTQIFASVGLEGSWPIYATIIYGLVNLIMTGVCVVLIEKAGRKLLLFMGMVGMCVFSFGLAIFRILGGPEETTLNYITVVCAVGYIIFFAIGPGAIPWLITTELFASDSRGKASSISVFVNWFSAFIITVTFPFIEEAIGNYSFFIFGGLSIFFSLFMFAFVPETKNKSIENIVSEFETRTFFFSFK